MVHKEIGSSCMTLNGQVDLTDSQRKKLFRWRRVNKCLPDLEKPKTFAEKQIYRSLFYKDPYYRLYATKVNAPLFVIGRMHSSLKLIRRYGAYQCITPDILKSIPADRFMIKSSWASGLNFKVMNKKRRYLREICIKINRKLDKIKNAQGFNDPYNSVIVEELIGEPDELLEDYKFHCIRDRDQNLQMIIQHYKEMEDGVRYQCAYDINYNRLDYSISSMPCYSRTFNKPEMFDTAVEIAHHLTAGFDYMRLDLYFVDGCVYFGEFTPFHKGGCARVTSRIHDLKLGRHWNMRRHIFQPEERVGQLLMP